MNDDERVVRDSWEHVTFEDHTQCCGEPDCFRVRMGDTPAKWGATEAEAWHASRLLTEARQEEVRLLEAEIVNIEDRSLDDHAWRVLLDLYVGDMPPWEWIVEKVREQCADCRTLQRLRDIRAGLTIGMKGEK